VTEDHDCESHVTERSVSEVLSGTVVMKGECSQCGRPLTLLFDLTKIEDSETKETVYEHSNGRHGS